MFQFTRSWIGLLAIGVFFQFNLMNSWGWEEDDTAIDDNGGSHAPANLMTYCARPVVVQAAIDDIREAGMNGLEGFAYFSNGQDAKEGILPHKYGLGPQQETYDTCAYASNFQGPVYLRGPASIKQWEWTADGKTEVSFRKYPLVYGDQCGTFPPTSLQEIRVKEHDERGEADDVIGAFRINPSYCKSAVFDRGLSSGWTSVTTTFGHTWDGRRHVKWVKYKLWCTKCPNGGGRCNTGVVQASGRDCIQHLDFPDEDNDPGNDDGGVW